MATGLGLDPRGTIFTTACTGVEGGVDATCGGGGSVATGVAATVGVGSDGSGVAAGCVVDPMAITGSTLERRGLNGSILGANVVVILGEVGPPTGATGVTGMTR